MIQASKKSSRMIGAGITCILFGVLFVELTQRYSRVSLGLLAAVCLLGGCCLIGFGLEVGEILNEKD